jgi:cell division protein FtsX
MDKLIKLVIVVAVLAIVVTLCIIFKKPILKTLKKWYSKLCGSKVVKKTKQLKNECTQRVKDKMSGQCSLFSNKKGA